LLEREHTLLCKRLTKQYCR